MTNSATTVTTTSDADALEVWRAWITHRLGRCPRGLRGIAAWNVAGEPSVIRVSSVVDGKPFPTLFWLIDPDLCLQLDRLEAAGCIARLQSEVDRDVSLQARMTEDHARHRRLRDAYLQPEERAHLKRHGMMAALDQRGIGGIAEPSRIRCLHTWFGAHLVEANTIGQMIEALLASTTATTATALESLMSTQSTTR